MHKTKKIVILIILLILMPILVTFAKQYKKEANFDTQLLSNLNIEKKAEKENKEEVIQDYDEEMILEMGFELVSENNFIKLYLYKESLNIAIYDKEADYYWFGYNPDLILSSYTDRIVHLINSGITVEYYESSSLNLTNVSITHNNAGTKLTYEMTDDGFKVLVDLTKVGISFQVVVEISDDELFVTIPNESIVEVPYQTAAMKFPREYKLHAIYLFPYLGAANYNTNGYAMIPDGSGALIRYTDIQYNTAYIRQIYGRDEGIQSTASSNTHLKPETNITMPLYGINHGYNQAAFLAQITSGYGAASIYSYPYKYNNIELNTTFFVFKARDLSLIRLSGGEISHIPIINKTPYPVDFSVKYSFLNGEKANYSGMAHKYRKDLDLKKNENQQMDMNLEILGLDFKPSLLGERKISLTTYNETKEIIEDLIDFVDGINLMYRNYGNNTLSTNNPYKFNLSKKLGGKKDFNNLIDYVLELDNVELGIVASPVEVLNTKAFSKTLKRTTLEQFYLTANSSRERTSQLLTIENFSNRILKNNKKYNKNEIDNLALTLIGNNSFSYVVGNKTIYREEMIDQVKNELIKLSDYKIGLYGPSNYAYKYIDSYFDAPYQTNSFAYITDTIPFVSLVLSGSVKLYSPHLNNSSDIDLMKLTLIEYNLRPSFIITKSEGFKLRDTHHEYLLTTEYDIWANTIKNTYKDLSVLKNVSGEMMLSHRYIDDDISEVVYETHIIYVNYRSSEYVKDGFLIKPYDYMIVEVAK